MNEYTRNEIIVRSLRGQSQREIATVLHVSRNTIKSVIQQREAARDGTLDRESQLAANRRGSILDDYETDIRELIVRYPKMKVVEIHRRLQALGYSASYTILRLRVKQIRQQLTAGRLAKTAAPGAVGKVLCRNVVLRSIDSKNLNATLFVFHLEYSGRVYVHLTPSNDLAFVIYEHLRAFEHFSGVTATIKYDELPSLFGSTKGSTVDSSKNAGRSYNQTFIRFANHYGFRPATNDGHDESVKSLVVQIERQLLAESEFRGIDHANDAIGIWCANNRLNVCTADPDKVEARSHESSFLIPLPQHPWSG
ncbi:MAG: transposase [Planctomycetales bacterium]|nr:transposase [Planctomycetales bacterium]